MMVTFLYFVEMCKGTTSREGKSKKKIVVIDDPISSLSHIFVYNVARIIANEFTAWNVVKPKDCNGHPIETYRYEQVFILTHNLYFFHELVERDASRRNEIQQLFRISKKNNCSSIHQMKYNEITNDYQSYWTFINRGEEADQALMANCMRHIIEYFFGFMENKDLNGVFQKDVLQDNDSQAFYRFINRESHSDSRNICDNKDFDFNRIAETFKNIFEVCGYGTHYNKMMKICKTNL